VFADAIGELRTSSMRAVLLDALDHEDRFERWAAAAGLGAMADPSTVDAVLLALQTERWPPVRASLIHAAGRIGDRRVLPTLRALIDEANDGWTRDALGVALGRLEAVEILETLLDRDLDTVHSVITRAMRYLPSRSADALKLRLDAAGYRVRFDPENPYARRGPTLVELDGLLESPDPSERLRAIDALEWRADWPALERLLDLLLDDDEDVASEAAQAITTMGENHNALVEAIRWLTATMADVADENRDAAGVALVRLWLNEEARAAVDESVGRFFDDLLDEAQLTELERFLLGDTPGSTAAAWVLTYSTSGGAALAQTISTGTGIGRWMAVWGVSRRGDPAVIPDLLARLSDEDIIEVRTAIADALGELDATTARDALAELLGDDAPATRAAAATALGRLGDPATVAPLLEALGDDDPDVRRAVAEAMGGLDGKGLVAALVQHLKEEDDADVAVALVEAVSGGDHPDLLAELQRRLDDGTPDVRTAAARALGEAGTASAARALIARLDVETDGDVVRDTAYAIGRVAERSTIFSVADRLISEDLNPLASFALGVAQRDDRSLVDALVEHLRSQGLTAIVARRVVEVERGDYLVRLIESGSGAIDGDSPQWLDRWEAVRLWALRSDEDAVAAIAAKLLDEDERVVRAAAHSLKNVFDDGPLSDVVWAAIGETTRTALDRGTFDRMTTYLCADGGPTEHWVLARPELLCELLPSYLAGREELRPVLWEIGDRYGLRLLGDGRVIMPAGDIVSCELAVARTLNTEPPAKRL
jgi:HEAT repeat protein